MSAPIIKDYKQQIISIINRVAAIAEEQYGDEYISHIKKVENLIDKSNPSLMFFGIYNAGKSTLLNAIFGDEKASVNDIPETHSVTEYSWGGYTLVDTPGLNAPCEGDEEVTLKEISKHDVIMFVIDDSDNFDGEIITRQIVDILGAQKPCIVVINRKNDSDKEHILEIKSKMAENIDRVSNIKHSYDFVDVDAKIALKAKKENKNLLLKESNIQELELCIKKYLLQAEGVKMLRVPCDNILLLCTNIKKRIASDSNDEKREKIQELLSETSDVRDNSVLVFRSELKGIFSRYADRIYQQMLLKNDADFDKKNCEEEVTKLINNSINNFCENVETSNRELIGKWRMELSVSLLPEERVEDFKTNRKENNSSIQKDEIDEMLDVLEKIPVTLPIPAPIPVPLPVVATILKGIKKILFGVGKENNINIEDYNEQAEEISRKRMFALKELKNNIEIQFEEYEREIEAQYIQQIDHIYEKRKNEITQTLLRQKEKDESKQEALKQLELIETQIKVLLSEI